MRSLECSKNGSSFLYNIMMRAMNVTPGSRTKHVTIIRESYTEHAYMNMHQILTHELTSVQYDTGIN